VFKETFLKNKEEAEGKGGDCRQCNAERAVVFLPRP